MTHFLKHSIWKINCFAILILGSLIIAGPLATFSASETPSKYTRAEPSEEIFIPAGQTLMGCASDIWHKCDLDSQPIHAVYLDAYFIDKTEVTVSQYAACMAAGVCSPPENMSMSMQQQATTQNDHPVTHVNWDQANTYCRWIGKRLPTEAEWEKAAHGVDFQIYPWGNQPPTCDRVNFNNCVGDVVPVGSYPENASPYGVLDMAGNVREWINDFYLKPYYERSPYYNPQGPKEEREHLLRGGSWKDDAGGLTTWIRFDEAETYYIYKAGIRCARTAPPDTIPTPTPPPTPQPTPTPYAVLEAKDTGSATWVSSPNHLTLLTISPNSMTDTQVITLTHNNLSNLQGDLQGINHFFEITTETTRDTSTESRETPLPIQLILGYKESGGVISNTLALYYLSANDWITENITPVTSLPGYLVVDIKETGIYGLMGETNRVYLPIIWRK